METKTVKMSANNYKALCEMAGELQAEWGEPVSIDKALTFLVHQTKLSDLAGSWKMSDKETEEFLKTVRTGWSRWKIKSV